MSIKEIEKKINQYNFKQVELVNGGVVGVKALAKSINAIPCPKCKELEQHLGDARKMEEYYRTVEIPERLVEISKLKAHIKEQIIISDKYVDEIDRRDKENTKLRDALVECHNKNTELKGDIARGSSKGAKFMGRIIGNQFKFEGKKESGNNYIMTKTYPKERTLYIYAREE